MAGATHINRVEHLVDVFVVDGTAEVLLKCLCDFIFREMTVMVDVDLAEETRQGLLLSLGQQMRDNISIGGLFKLLSNFECLHVCKSILDLLLCELIQVFLHVLALILMDVILPLEKGLILDLKLVQLEPLVIQSLLGRKSLFGVIAQDLCYKVFGLGADVSPLVSSHVIFTNFDESHDFKVMICIERWSARQKGVHDDSTAPDVAFVVVILIEDLGRQVVWCSLSVSELMTFWKFDRKAKINQFQRIV